MLQRLLLSGVVALGVATAMLASTAAQPIGGAGSLIAQAGALAARIRAFHHGWTGLTPPPPSYCPTMREGEAVLKELARLSSRAILVRAPGLALQLQAAGDRLSDELDEEEEINNVAGIPYDVFPCPVPTSAYPARTAAIGVIERRMPFCRVELNALRLSFEARRAQMQQCLRGRL
jgi:hypothetical protein